MRSLGFHPSRCGFWAVLWALPLVDAACSAGQFYANAICSPCPAGTYCPLSTGCASNCTACPPNSGCMPGATTCLGPFCQACPPGYYCGGGLSIQVCPLPYCLWYLRWFMPHVCRSSVCTTCVCIASCLWYLHWFMPIVSTLVRVYGVCNGICIGSYLWYLHWFVSMLPALVRVYGICNGICIGSYLWYLHWLVSMLPALVRVYATCIGSCLWYLHWFVATLPALVRLHWFVCIGSGLHQCMHPVCLPHWCVDLGKGPDRAVLLERTAPRPASTPAPSASFARPAPTHLAPTQPSVSCAPQAPTPPLRPTPSAQHARQAPTSQAQGSLCARSVSQATTSQLRASPPAPSARKAPGRASQAPACASSVQQEFLPRRQGWETCRGAFRALRAPTRRCWGEMRHVPLAQRDGISPEQAVPRVCLARWGPMLRAPVPLPAQAAPP